MVRVAQSVSIADSGSIRFIFLFCVSFLLPIGLLGGYFYMGRSGMADPSLATDRGERPRAFLVRDGGDFVRFKDGPTIEPAGDRDFFLAISLKFLELPVAEQKTFLLQKYDKNSESGQGYAIAFVRDTDGIHPLVYWKNTEGFGRWFRYAALPVIEKQWFALALSFLRGEFLGLHALTAQGNGIESRLLGGYRLDTPVYPASDSDLIIGSLSSGNPLHGRLGGMIIVQRDGLDADLQGLLTGVRIDPITGTLKQNTGIVPSIAVESFSESRFDPAMTEFVTLYRSGNPVTRAEQEDGDGS